MVNSNFRIKLFVSIILLILLLVISWLYSKKTENFQGETGPEKIPLTDGDEDTLHSLKFAIQKCKETGLWTLPEYGGHINNWDVSGVTDMSAMFAGVTSFNQDISQWDVSNVEDMEYMFKDAKSFNRNISNWKPKYRTTSPDWVFKGSQMYFKNMYPKEWQRYSRLR